MPRIGIAGRVFLYIAAIVCAVLGVALAVASSSGRRAAMEEERRGLEQAADLTAQHMAGRGRSLAGGARVFVQGPYFRALVAERRRDDVLDQAFEAADQLGADWVFITDERGTLLAKSDEPGVTDVQMSGIPLVAGALEGRTTSGYGVSRDSLLFQAVGVPIVVPGGAPVGVLVATRIVDDQAAKDVRATTGAEVVFYSVAPGSAARVAASSFAAREQAAAVLPSAAGADTVRFALQGATLTTAGGEIVGGFVVARPRLGMPREIAGVRRSLLVAGVLGFLLALLAAWHSARRLTRPARALAAAAERARDGDYESAARAALSATAGAPRDEIAALGGALATLLGELREKQALVAMLGGASTVARDDVEATPETAPAPEPAAARLARRTRGAPAVAQPLTAPWSSRPSGILGAGAVVADRYTVIEAIGAGGTGIVYKATDRTLGEIIALKMLRPDLVTFASLGAGADDPRAHEELKHELRLARRVSHRNVVRTHDFGSSRGVPFITMEHVEGASLAALLARRGALPASVVLALARQLLRALDAAHEQGVTHGDLKPANLLVARDGTLKVTDFGQSLLVRRPRALAPGETVIPPRLAGAVVGTPEYMAPEQLLGGAASVRTDLYAAGMVLHECLTGDTPFPRDTPRGFLARKLDAAPQRREPPRDRERHPTTLGEGLGEVVAWMTATDPADRPASAAAVSRALDRLDPAGE